MPESDAPKTGAPPIANLPMPIPRPAEIARDKESWIGRVVRSMFGWKSGTIRADLETILNTDETANVTGFSPAESRLLRNILELRERRINDVMLPRADIVSVPHDIAIGDLVKVFESAAHSRLVVYNETLDDPVGIVHIRDLIAYMTKHAAAPPKKPTRRKAPVAGLDFKAVDLGVTLSSVGITRPLLYVPPSMPALDLLAKMQATRIHLALVIDEYGGSDGLVSMEDIVEQIVGDIQDEHDEGSIHTIARQADGSFLADGRASLEEVVAAIGPEFETGEAGEEVDTLGGFVIARGGRVPVRGELVSGPGLFEFEILDGDPRRIKKIRIYQRKRAREASATRTTQTAASTAAEQRPEGAASTTASSNDESH